MERLSAGAIELHVIPILSDNYLYAFRNRQTGQTGVVDPGDAQGSLDGLRHLGWQKLDVIVITHRHADHIGGLKAVRQELGGTVVAPQAEARQIGPVDHAVRDGDEIALAGLHAHVLATPGHTRGHVCYYLPDGPVLFAGDTLFALGCGRLFEGTPGDMWQSLQRLRALPADTLACCGHEYTATNARFARDVDGANPAVQERSETVRALRSQNRPTLPTTIGAEVRTNPFFRSNEPALASNLGKQGAAPVDVFAELRQRRNRY